MTTRKPPFNSRTVGEPSRLGNVRVARRSGRISVIVSADLPEADLGTMPQSTSTSRAFYGQVAVPMRLPDACRTMESNLPHTGFWTISRCQATNPQSFEDFPGFSFSDKIQPIQAKPYFHQMTFDFQIVPHTVKPLSKTPDVARAHRKA